MIHQLIVISSEGLAILDRTYDENAIDPFLVSGFLAAVIPRMDEFGFTLDSLVSELKNKEDTYLTITSKENMIYAALASSDTPKEVTQNLLETVAEEITPDIPKLQSYAVDKNTIEQMQDKLDVIISQEGVTASSTSSEEGLLPILNQVFEGKMKPDKAAKLILKAIKGRDRKSLEAMKQSLVMLDSMFPPTKGSQMNTLQVVIKSTYKGVSKLVVRMDQALSF